MLTSAKSILFAKSTTIDPFLFLVPAPYLLIISSSPMFSLSTCPFRSAPKTILSYFDTLSMNPFRSSQKSFFSSMLLLTCGAYAFTIFRIDHFTSSFMAISLSDTLFISKKLWPAPPSPPSLSHFFFHQLRCKIVCSHLQCSSLYSLSTLFPIGIVCLHSFAPSSLPAFFLFQSCSYI